MNIIQLRKLVEQVVQEEKKKSKHLNENKRIKNLMNIFERVLTEDKDEETVDLYSDEEQRLSQDAASPDLKNQIAELKKALESASLASVVKILNKPAMQSREAIEMLNMGDGQNDKVSVQTGGSKPVQDLSPTQSEIFCSQSLAYPLSNWNTITDTVSGKVFGGISVAEGLILDGHHRWSAAFAQDPSCSIPCRDFQFGKMSPEEILGRLQVGIAGQRSPGEDLPYADGGDLETGPEGAEPPIKKPPNPDNILNKDAKYIQNRISTLTGTDNTDPNVAKFGGDPVFFGDDYFKQMAANPSPAALKLVGLVETDIGTQLPVTECTGNGLSCPVRKKIIEKLSDNLKNLPTNTTAPKRKFMPQLDHEDIGGKQGLNNIVQGFQQGTVNHAEPYLEGSKINLDRWNKLAGILKD